MIMNSEIPASTYALVKRDNTGINMVPTTSWGLHLTNILTILNDHLFQLQTVVEIVFFNEELQELEGLLRAVSINLRHRQVIYEYPKLLSLLRTILPSCAFRDVVLYCSLEIG